MTTIDKLDEFARAALTGLIASNRDAVITSGGFSDYAVWAYRYAEAMAAERERVIERRRASARAALPTNEGTTTVVRETRCFTED